MATKDIKRAIEDYEYYQNGFQKLSGYSVKVINLKVLKDKYVCDTILTLDCGEKVERFNDCLYPKKVIQDWLDYTKSLQGA